MAAKRQIKKQKARQRYQRALLRKPKYIREMGAVLPILLVLMILVDYIFTYMAATDYIALAIANVEKAQNNVADSIYMIEKKYGSDLDFTQVTMSDGQINVNYEDEVEKEKLEMAISHLIMKTNMPLWQEYNTWFGIMYQTYQFIRTKGWSLYEWERPAHTALINTNGDIIANQEPNVIQIVVENEDMAGAEDKEAAGAEDKDTAGAEDTPQQKAAKRKAHIYRLDTVQIDKKHPGISQQIMDEANPLKNGHINTQICLEELYVRGIYVLPRKIKIYNDGYMGETAGGLIINGNEESLMAEYDLYDCDFTGYTRLETDDEKMKVLNPIVLGVASEEDVLGVASEGDEHGQAFMALNEEQIKANLAKTKSDDITDIEQNDYRYKGYKWVNTPNDSLVAAIYFDYDFWRDCGKMVTSIYFLSIVPVLIVALIWGRLRYNKKRISYEVDSYRRETTNAMAHDLKSPLMAISGYAENMLQCGDAEKMTYYANGIQSVVKDMDRMIANILELAKLEDAALSMNIKEVSMTALVKEQLVKYEPIIEEKKLRIVTDGEAWIKADGEWMGHLIDNLLSNAVRYSTSDSEIKITMENGKFTMQNETQQEIKVSPEQLVKPFVKGDAARNNTQGNGFGLSIAYHIAQAHGFMMTVRSEEKKFVVELKL